MHSCLLVLLVVLLRYTVHFRKNHQLFGIAVRMDDYIGATYGDERVYLDDTENVYVTRTLLLSRVA